MKRLLYIAALLYLSSCSVLIPRETSKQVMVIDFRPYSDAGFFLSPSNYPGEHTPVGLLNMVIDPAVVEFTVETDKYEDSFYKSYFPEMVEQPLLSADLIDMAVHEAAIRGANGIANLKIEVVTHDYGYRRTDRLLGSTYRTMPVHQYIVSGFLIRIPIKE